MNDNPSASPDAAPTQALWVQLATCVTTQPLHYRSGEEETAAENIAELFGKVRGLLEKHPDAAEFRALSVRLLNDTLRPYTARWHGWLTADEECLGADGKPVLRFRDEQVRRQFRAELRELQVDLREVRGKLASMAGTADVPVDNGGPTAKLGGPLSAGIRLQVEIKTEADAGTRLVTHAEINAEEHKTLLERRIALELLQKGDRPRSQDELSAVEPGAAEPAEGGREVNMDDAVGLALSGGGIRSATFCLGIVQVLARKGLLPQFDYQSTVSGGGYFGSFLSTALGTCRPETAPSDPGQPTGGVWESLKRLLPARKKAVATDGGSPGQAKSSKELAEERITDVFLRHGESRQQGIESGLVRHLRNNSKYLLHGGLLGKMRMVGLMLSGILWNVMILLSIPLMAALFIHSFGNWFWGEALYPGPLSLTSMLTTRAGCILWAFATVLGALWVVLPAIEMLARGKLPQSSRAILCRACRVAAFVLALLTLGAAVFFLVPAMLRLHEWLRTNLADRGIVGFPLSLLDGSLPASLVGVAGVALAAVAAWLTPRWPRLRSAAARLFILSGPLLLLFACLFTANQMGIARSPGAGVPWSPPLVSILTFVLTVWTWLFVNINALAPHRYYRNRLCECYLARRVPAAVGRERWLLRWFAGEPAQGRTEVLQQVKLSSLGKDLTAPYHLINMTLNVPTSANKNLRGRGSDFFLASKWFYGSPLTGYARTTELERRDPHFDLGTAMAVSGAAASTNMGWKTLPHFRFLMTLLNVRLGYWLRNPGRSTPRWQIADAGPWYLVREMLGCMDENCRYVNLSDGGHIENLAAYELLRRRCKFIVCVDGGCEPGMECTDLIRLQRYAEIDLGIRMHFDMSDLQVGANGLSRAHAILVKIDYAPETAPGQHLGWMLYLKLAMIGAEPSHVKDYKRENPCFPHQTTADQIYDEAQFEAHRALGECAMDGMFRNEIVGSDTPDNIRDWFQCLADNLLPDNDEVFPKPTV